LELFELTKVIFEKPAEWSTVTNGDKRKNFFMCQRRFAIQHPIQANALQPLRIEQSCVMDFWQQYMTKTYRGRTPHWMFISGAKKAKEKKEAKISVSDSLVNEYSKRMEIDKKSVYDALEHYPDMMLAELKSFQKMIEQK
jgi:hypothetical protein